jgi:predicted NBD/HSP70 family sugar kinase
LAALLSGRVLDRNQIIETTGLSRATVFRIIDDLQAQGLVRDADTIASPGPGRPSVGVRLDRGDHLVCGIDLGGTNCRVLIADLLGRTLIRARFATPRTLDGPGIADWIADQVHELVDETEATDPTGGRRPVLGALAVGVPGAVSGDARRVVRSQNLGQITGADFIDRLDSRVDAPVVIDNDSNLALLGELRYGSSRIDDTVALLAVGTGIGSAAAIKGRMLRAAEGHLGEFGRLNLPGTKVRLRDLVSGAGLVGYARSIGLDLDDPRELLADPERYPGLYRQVCEALVHLIAVVALAYEPDTVLMTGGFSDGLSDQLLADLEQEAAEVVSAPVRIRRASLGDNSGLYGAMASALTRLHTELGVLPEDLTRIEVDRRTLVDAFDRIPVQVR